VIISKLLFDRLSEQMFESGQVILAGNRQNPIDLAVVFLNS
jgi:hypothetical protein